MPLGTVYFDSVSSVLQYPKEVGSGEVLLHKSIVKYYMRRINCKVLDEEDPPTQPHYHNHITIHLALLLARFWTPSSYFLNMFRQN